MTYRDMHTLEGGRLPGIRGNAPVSSIARAQMRVRFQQWCHMRIVPQTAPR
mgnify:CR=1 FL=1